MVENDADKHCLTLSEVPKSAKLSLIRNKDENDKEIEPTLNQHLLQVTVRDKTIIFNIESEEPEEKFFLNATSQFISLNKYFETGLRVFVCQEDQSYASPGYLISKITTNRCKDLCFLRQDRILKKKLDKEKLASLPKTPPVLGIFRQYTEADLFELKRI